MELAWMTKRPNRPEFPIFRPDRGESRQVIVAGPWDWIWLHWVGNRTYPHWVRECVHCNQGKPTSKAYAPGYVWGGWKNNSKSWCKMILEIGSWHAQDCDLWVGKCCKVSRATKEQGGKTSWLLLEGFDMGKVPETFLIRPSLMLHWNEYGDN